MDNNTFYFNSYITERKRKILRLIELVCCIVCFALAVTVFIIRLHLATKVILMVVSTTFLFITLVDATSWLQSRPMGHRTWVIFSVTAFHMFCLCGGFLVFLRRVTNQTLLLATCIVNFVTANVYILDCLLIVLQYIRWIHRNNTRVVPITVHVDRAVSTCMVPVHQEWEYIAKGGPRLRSSLRRPYVLPTYSYGGTFAVNKDFPPLPTPDPLRKFTPRRRMYCTMVNPEPILDGSGDFSRSCKTTPPKEIPTNAFSIAKDKTFRLISTNYRVEIHTSKRFYSKIWPHPLLQKFQYPQKRSQSYGEESAAVLGAEINQKKIDGTNVAQEGDPGDKKQASKDMIVAYCKQQSGGHTPISMQDCVFHHYYQQPCFKCGKTHYQQQTTINGTLCCPPVVCTTGKNENSCPVQVIQIPCGNMNYPGTQGTTMQGLCGNPNCPGGHGKREHYIESSSSYIRRNGLEPEYALRRRNGYQEVECPPCGRRYRPKSYDDEPDMYCIKECPRPSKYTDNQHYCPCCCGCTAATVATETCAEAGQQKNSEVMAVQEMIDKTVQMMRDTSEYNPQTSETRIMTASFIKKLLEGKCDKKCTGIKSSREGSSKFEGTSELEMTSESEEAASREHQDSKILRASKVPKAPTVPSKSKQMRLSAGGPLQQFEISSDGSRKDITVPLLQTRSLNRQTSLHAPTVSKTSIRMAQEPIEEIDIQRSYAAANLENLPRKQSVCDCIALGKPSKDCKRLRTQRNDEYGKNRVSYRVLAQDSSDEPIRETMYDEIDLDTEEPVEEPLFQKTRLLYRSKTQPSSISSRRIPPQPQDDLSLESVEEPQFQKTDVLKIQSKISNREIQPQKSINKPTTLNHVILPENSAHEPSIKSRISNREIQPERSVHEPPIKSRISNREIQPQRSVHEPSIKSRISNREIQPQRSVHEPSMKSKISNAEIQPKRSLYEPSIKSRISNRDLQSQRSIHEEAIEEVEEEISVDKPSIKSGQQDETITLPYPLRYALIPTENEEWCEKCCTREKIKPKKRCWNIFKRKKK